MELPFVIRISSFFSHWSFVISHFPGGFEMKSHRTFAAVVALGIGAGAALFLISCSSMSNRSIVAPLEIPGAHFVGNQVCAQCHTQIARAFPASPHARMVSENSAIPGGASCEACHGPGSMHVEAGGGAKFIINPGKAPDACFRCHLRTQAEFQLPVHHPVIEGHMNCVQYHDPHGGDIFKPKGGLAMARQNESCAQCHRDQTRPFVFDHPAMREGCVVCHNPHGSINQKMLVESDPNLCLRCHAQVQGANVPGGHIYIGNTDHTTLLQVGTCWTSGCHTAIHGSNVDPRLRY
jgi:predicted CXXCH cytochrome family protein